MGQRADHFREAMNFYSAQHDQEGMQTRSRSRSILTCSCCCLNRRFAEAIDFAQTRLKADPREQPNMGKLIANEAQSLLTTDVKAALDLLKRADEMVPPLDDKYKGWLRDVSAQIPKNTSSNETGAPEELSAFSQPAGRPLG